MLLSKSLDLGALGKNGFFIYQVSLLLWRASTALSAPVDLVAVLHRYKQNRWAQS